MTKSKDPTENSVGSFDLVIVAAVIWFSRVYLASVG